MLTAPAPDSAPGAATAITLPSALPAMLVPKNEFAESPAVESAILVLVKIVRSLRLKNVSRPIVG